MIYSLADQAPKIPSTCFVAPGAMLMGNIELDDQVSIWFNAVLRGDNALIKIGQGSNIQDGAVLHVDDDASLTIGRRVTVGHKVMLHGCTIGDGSLIGMNAVVLNHAKIGRRCLIGANALVTEGMEIPDDSLVLGSPGKVVKTLDEKAIAGMDAGTQHYINKIAIYQDSLKPVR